MRRKVAKNPLFSVTTNNYSSYQHQTVHQNSANYQDYSSMYSTMDPTMAWHAAAYSANLYRGYEAAVASEAGVWPPQSHAHHMNSFIPASASDGLGGGPEAAGSLALSDGGFLASATSNGTVRPNSPSEYKVFNNNESREEVKRPSPDSGMADGTMSNSGSPAHPHTMGQGSPIPGSNLVVRPQPARSPYEWMKRPNTGNLQGRPSKEG